MTATKRGRELASRALVNLGAIRILLIGAGIAVLLATLGTISWEATRQLVSLPSASTVAVALASFRLLAIFLRPHSRRIDWSDVLEAGALGSFALTAAAAVQLSTVLHPSTLDTAIASSLFDRLVLPSPTGKNTSSAAIGQLVYWLLVAAVGTTTALDPMARRNESRSVLTILVRGTLIAYVLCLLIPLRSSPLLELTHPTHQLASLGTVALDAATSAANHPSRLGLFSFPALWSWLLLGTWRRWVRPDLGLQSRQFHGLLIVIALLVPLVERLWRGSSWLSLGASAILAGLLGSLPVDRRPKSDKVQGELLLGTVFRPSLWALATIFFISGFAALVYQVMFAKGMALAFGSTSHAGTIVLATYMGGLAFGSWHGGKLAQNTEHPVRTYALAELGVALLCVLAPFTLMLVRRSYVSLASGHDPSSPWLLALQLALGALVLVPPTWMMGLTMPLLTRRFLRSDPSLGTSVGWLYGSNTLGAALGALTTGYFLLPSLGLKRTLYFAVGCNVLVALSALSLGEEASPAEPAKDSGEPLHGSTSPLDSSQVDPPAHATILQRRLASIAITQLTVGGFVTFGLETTFVHLLATVAGTSTYAFSLMLFAFLVGLSWGASWGRRWVSRGASLAWGLWGCQALLALLLLLGHPYWNGISEYFASFGSWPPARSFAAREVIRFLVCLIAMLPPALCIGAQYPIAMEAVGQGSRAARVTAMGRAAALNTLGNIAGAIVVGFVCLPLWGSLKTIYTMSGISIALALLAVSGVPRRTSWGLLSGLALLGCLVLLPGEFDLSRLASGGNVYFKPQNYGTVIDHAESLDGGLTTVTLKYAHQGIPVKTLLTNGKFQGNDRLDSSGELVAQSSFALAPLLHTARRQRGLVIGFGTGTTARVLHDAGFEHLTIAELSGDIVRLADRHFSQINRGVVRRPGVEIELTDGRNFLLLDRHNYDLISIELSSIWFQGAANLYNGEFYDLVKTRLAQNGVLQQWVQLHRLSLRDIATILATIRSRFARLWFYYLGKQGIVVACEHDCSPNQVTLDGLTGTSRLAPTLALFPEGPATVLKACVLSPPRLDEFLAASKRKLGLSSVSLISTDDNLYLEYSTPRGNVRDYDQSLDENLAALRAFQAPTLQHGAKLIDFLPPDHT